MPRTTTTRLAPRTPAEMTFGIEIECSLPREVAIAPGGYHSGRQVPELPQGWTAESDSSIRPAAGHRGIEIVSPILRGTDGLRQIERVCKQLNEWGAKVNSSTGLHIHIGCRRDDAKGINNMLWTIANFETAIYASTGSISRINSTYTGTIKNANAPTNPTTIQGMARAARGLTRYQTINLQNIFSGRRPTIEIRAFAGTTNGAKVIAYTRLCLAMMERSETKRRIAWDAARPQATSCVARKSGRGATELTRLFYTLGWIKGRESHEFGSLHAEDLPTLKDTKKTLTALARKFDAKMAARNGGRAVA